MTFTRTTIDPEVCTGKPCVRGLRFPVARLLGLLAAGETREQILEAYPYLEPLRSPSWPLCVVSSQARGRCARFGIGAADRVGQAVRQSRLSAPASLLRTAPQPSPASR
ncbi:MAG: DUF433 domain-containing protein [Propylenella sp.]